MLEEKIKCVPYFLLISRPDFSHDLQKSLQISALGQTGRTSVLQPRSFLRRLQGFVRSFLLHNNNCYQKDS
jgi:hypothetical protein